MDLLSRILGPVNIPSGTNTLFTGVLGHTYTIKHITVVNSSGGDINVALGIGGVTGDKLILASTLFNHGDTAEFDGMLVLGATETLDAIADVSGLTITISGLDQGA